MATLAILATVLPDMTHKTQPKPSGWIIYEDARLQEPMDNVLPGFADGWTTGTKITAHLHAIPDGVKPSEYDIPAGHPVDTISESRMECLRKYLADHGAVDIMWRPWGWRFNMLPSQFDRLFHTKSAKIFKTLKPTTGIAQIIEIDVPYKIPKQIASIAASIGMQAPVAAVKRTGGQCDY